MMKIHCTNVKGIVQEGHGVASGKSKDSRFPGGTIEMQKPLFYKLGLNLNSYFSGTINLSIFPYQFNIKKPRYIFKNVKWSANYPSENFSFLDCKIIINKDNILKGMIYYPHPETKVEHFQAPYIFEIITTYIDGLKYGDELIIEVDNRQISIYS